MNFYRVLSLAFLLFVASCVCNAQCTFPPSEPISLTWPPSVTVQVFVDTQVNIFNAVTNAVNNWNNALINDCYAPLFSFGAGTGPAMWFAYGAISTPPNSTVAPRGKAIINSSGRIASALSTINNNIPLTFPNVMTETVAHEIGHTMGLNDCIYQNTTNNPCPTNSNVMIVQAPVATWTGLQGQPGPTVCDLDVMDAIANDYGCPPPPPPSPIDCSCTNSDTQPVCCGSPIIIDTDGKGFSLTNAANGVTFDIFNTHHPVKLAWTAVGSTNAFLVLPAPDGLVHSSRQMFGNFTPQPPSSNPNGFVALTQYDQPSLGGNSDGVIDANDAIFSQLRLWIDSNHNGISESNELYTLPSLGVYSISLSYKADRRTDQYGNLFRDRAQVNPGSATDMGRIAYDVYFRVEGSNTAKGKCVAPPGILPKRPEKVGGR